MAAEENRVADAGALADLLLPLLTQHMRAAPPTAAPAARRPAAKAADSAEVPSVADFIDDMLAQERAARRRPS